MTLSSHPCLSAQKKKEQQKQERLDHKRQLELAAEEFLAGKFPKGIRWHITILYIGNTMSIFRSAAKHHNVNFNTLYKGLKKKNGLFQVNIYPILLFLCLSQYI